MTISDYYRDQNRALHQQSIAAGKPWGTSGKKYVDEVMAFMQEIGAQNILDYGCGQCTLTKALRFRNVTLPIQEYDPAILSKQADPISADLVVCTDVMEHVEPVYIQAVLDHIYWLANKAAYIVIACNDSMHKLPDGRSAHLSIHPPAYWIGLVEKMKWRAVQHVETPKKVTLWLLK